MIYIFDIMLNFNKEYYSFYEWDRCDNVVCYKKIPLFKISNKFMEDIFKYNIKINKEFLTILNGKNDQNNLSVLFTDSNNIIGLKFDKNGLIMEKSSIIIDDELEILELSNNLKELVLDYECKNENNNRIYSRIEEKLKDNLLNRVDNLENGLIKYLNYTILGNISEDNTLLKNQILNNNYFDNMAILNNIFEILSIK